MSVDVGADEDDDREVGVERVGGEQRGEDEEPGPSDGAFDLQREQDREDEEGHEISEDLENGYS